jgi:hypothetical protein
LSGNLPTRVLIRHPEKESSLALTVDEISAVEVRLRLHGSLPLRYHGWDLQNQRVPEGDYDCEYEFVGHLTCDRRTQTFTRFDLVALGPVKQLGSFKYPRPAGGMLINGLTFELGDGTVAESIPPYRLQTGRASDYFSHDEP